jgi:hypothetical protein
MRMILGGIGIVVLALGACGGAALHLTWSPSSAELGKISRGARSPRL